MANRAYLYPSDRIEFAGWRERRPYYDSRHTIPIGWFFFFHPRDVLLVDVQDWKEVKLAAPKAPALKVFAARRPLLEPYLEGQPLQDAAAAIVRDLERWPGKYLLMDPVEVVEDDKRHKKQFEDILSMFEPGADGSGRDAALRRYCSSFSVDPDKRRGEILGYTYAWGV